MSDTDKINRIRSVVYQIITEVDWRSILETGGEVCCRIPYTPGDVAEWIIDILEEGEQEHVREEAV